MHLGVQLGEGARISKQLPGFMQEQRLQGLTAYAFIEQSIATIHLNQLADSRSLYATGNDCPDNPLFIFYVFELEPIVKNFENVTVIPRIHVSSSPMSDQPIG